MVCVSTIIQRMLIKINVEEEETTDNFMEISNSESKVTWQQTSFISVAISMGKSCDLWFMFYTFSQILEICTCNLINF